MIKNQHADESLLNEYEDGMLSTAKAAELEAHLRGCLECQARLKEIRFVFQALEDLPEVPLEVDLVDEVITIIKSQPVDISTSSSRSRSVGFRSIWRLVTMNWRTSSGTRSLEWLSLVQILSTLALLLATWPFILRMIPARLFASISAQIELSQVDLSSSWWLRWNMLWSSFQATLEGVWEAWYGLPGQLGELHISPLGTIVLLVVAVSMWVLINGLLLTKRKANGYASLVKRRT